MELGKLLWLLCWRDLNRSEVLYRGWVSELSIILTQERLLVMLRASVWWVHLLQLDALAKFPRQLIEFLIGHLTPRPNASLWLTIARLLLMQQVILHGTNLSHSIINLLADPICFRNHFARVERLKRLECVQKIVTHLSCLIIRGQRLNLRLIVRWLHGDRCLTELVLESNMGLTYGISEHFRCARLDHRSSTVEVLFLWLCITWGVLVACSSALHWREYHLILIIVVKYGFEGSFVYGHRLLSRIID